MKRKTPDSTPDLMFCGHSHWKPEYKTLIIPDKTYLYVYAPLGAALDQTVARAIAAGETIQSGDLQIGNISPITLFNFGYDSDIKADFNTKIMLEGALLRSHEVLIC